MGFRRMFAGVSGAVLDAVYPPLCPMCSLVTDDTLCASCRLQLTRWEPSRVLLEGTTALDEAHQIYHYEGLAKHMVQLLKYERWTQLGPALASEIASFAAEHHWFDADNVAPVPIHWYRAQIRGFNQAEVLCSMVPQELLDLGLIKRTRWTRAQAKLDKAAREHNLDGAFKADAKVKGKSVLLLDDVFTTGTTAVHCAKALKEAGAARVTSLMFAGVGDPAAGN